MLFADDLVLSSETSTNTNGKLELARKYLALDK